LKLAAALLSSFQDSYQPARIADGLWIVPAWSEPADPAATNILLEPGSFESFNG
jgi:ribosomal protein L11 methylase PrmA